MDNMPLVLENSIAIGMAKFYAPNCLDDKVGYPGVGLVTFEFTEREGATTLSLTNTVQEDFPDEVPEFRRECCLAGWRYLIGQSLREYLER